MSIMHEVGHEVLGHELPTEGDAASWFRTSCEHRNKRDERELEEHSHDQCLDSLAMWVDYVRVCF